MGKASTNKKVARAAATGGGARAGRGFAAGPWKWYAVISIAVVLGMILLVTSRQERQEAISKVGPPRPGDHWHVAYGLNVCGIAQPGLTNETDPQGIHTHAPEGQPDGIIHVHPFTTLASGDKATLGKFVDAAALPLEDGKLTMPDGQVYQNGDKCGGKESVLRVKYDGKVFTENLRDIRFTKDRSSLTIFFGPKEAEIPDPPSAENLNKLSDVPPDQQQPVQEIPGDPSATTAPGAPPEGEPSGGDIPAEGTPQDTTPTSGAGTTQAP